MQYDERKYLLFSYERSLDEREKDSIFNIYLTKARGAESEYSNFLLNEMENIIYTMIKTNKVSIEYKHLGSILCIDAKFIESEYFLSKWVMQNTKDISSIVNLFYVCITRGNFNGFYFCNDLLKNIPGAGNFYILTQSLIYLKLNNIIEAEKNILQLTNNISNENTAFALLEIGLKSENSTLISSAILSKFSKSVLEKIKDKAHVKYILIKGIIECL